MAVMILTVKKIFLGQIETIMQKTLYTTSCSVPVCCIGKGPKTYCILRKISKVYIILFILYSENVREHVLLHLLHTGQINFKSHKHSNSLEGQTQH